MTPKCIFPSRYLLLRSRLVYPIVFLTSLLTIWLKYSSHLTHQKWKSWFPPLLKSVYSSLFISANGATIYPVVQARNLKASLISPLFASYSTYNPSQVLLFLLLKYISNIFTSIYHLHCLSITRYIIFFLDDYNSFNLLSLYQFVYHLTT